jgi:hypothetical protein
MVRNAHRVSCSSGNVKIKKKGEERVRRGRNKFEFRKWHGKELTGGLASQGMYRIIDPGL